MHSFASFHLHQSVISVINTMEDFVAPLAQPAGFLPLWSLREWKSRQMMKHHIYGISEREAVRQEVLIQLSFFE